MLFIYIQIANIAASPQIFAEYFLFYHISFNLQVSNYGINFFLYVISDKKFRNDLMKLFQLKSGLINKIASKRTDNSSK